MENSLVQGHSPAATKAAGGFLRVFARKQTYLNFAYLLAESACGLLDLTLVSICGAAVFGLIAMPLELIGGRPFGPNSLPRLALALLGGALAVPAAALVCFIPAVLEQQLAGPLLKMDLRIKPFWCAGRSLLRQSGKYLVSGAAWKRVAFCLLRIPLALIFFLTILLALLVFFALFTVPILYLAGFHELIILKWRVDSFMEGLSVFLAALALTPFVLHASNLLARLSGQFARRLLSD